LRRQHKPDDCYNEAAWFNSRAGFYAPGTCDALVAKAQLDSERAVWLSTPWPDGSRTVVSLRELAAVFETPDQARIAIDYMPEPYRLRLSFSVEPAE
jgi:hypothetical protein